MPDLKDQMHNYIEGLAEPVSVHESMSHEARSARSYPVPAAVLAGAAVVLIPALLLVGIRWWPGDADPSGPATVTSIADMTATTPTTAPETTTPITAPLESISVPDLDGLTAEEAASALSLVGLELEIVEMYPSRSGFGLVSAQDPLPGEEATSGDSVQVGISVEAPCLTAAPMPEVPDGSMAVNLLFECAGDGLSPDISASIIRIVPSTPDVIEATLQALLAGPTDEERTMGFSSFFTEESSAALNSVTLDGTRLIVDFNEDILIGNASTSTGSQYFSAELAANLYQFAEVESIEYQLDGSCEAFYNWLQGSCQISTRGDWEQRVAAWEAERALSSSSGTELAVDDIVGTVFAISPTATAQDVLRVDGGDATTTTFTEVGRWLLEDPGSDLQAKWAIHVIGLNEEMIWLATSDDAANDGPANFRVRAALIVPWEQILPSLRADAFLLNGAESCTRNGDPDPDLVVVAELTETSGGEITGATTPVRAWLMDTEAATFDEIPTDNIECFVDLG